MMAMGKKYSEMTPEEKRQYHNEAKRRSRAAPQRIYGNNKNQKRSG
jgi:hypothetical protein